MQDPDVQRATAAAISVARELGLRADAAAVLQNANKLALRLSPCDAFARIADLRQAGVPEGAQAELALGARLAEMAAAWRWDAGDQFPNGAQWALQFTRTLRQGPPWPSLQATADAMARGG